MPRISRSFGNLLTCVWELVLGILLLIDPLAFTSGILMVIGILAFVVATVDIIQYFGAPPREAAQENRLAMGILLLLAGYLFVFQAEWLIATFPLFTVFYGVLTLVNGVNKIQWAVDMLRMKQTYWYVAVISAGLTIGFSLLILANPFSSLTILWTVLAATLIIESILDIVTLILDWITRKKEEPQEPSAPAVQEPPKAEVLPAEDAGEPAADALEAAGEA